MAKFRAEAPPTTQAVEPRAGAKKNRGGNWPSPFVLLLLTCPPGHPLSRRLFVPSAAKLARARGRIYARYLDAVGSKR